jgi:Icc-related predicted phosphoesterase
MITRIFFTSDIHGSEKVFKKFLNAGKFYKANVLILGGDITGKLIVPIVKQYNGFYTTENLGTAQIIKDQKELEELKTFIRSSGYYPYITEPKEFDELKADKSKVYALFSKLMIETLRSWLKLAEARLSGTGIKCFIMPGNDDRYELDQVFNEFNYVINPDGKVVLLDDKHEMISLSESNITPWHAPRDVPEDYISKKIEDMISKVNNMNNCIFNFHCPPYNSGLDVAPKLDNNLKPVAKRGQIELIPVGSIAVRKAIEKYQPLLGLHGHIHESRGIRKIGRTICINPGSEYGEGILRGVIVDLDERGVKNYQLTSG